MKTLISLVAFVVLVSTQMLPAQRHDQHPAINSTGGMLISSTTPLAHRAPASFRSPANLFASAMDSVELPAPVITETMTTSPQIVRIKFQHINLPGHYFYEIYHGISPTGPYQQDLSWYPADENGVIWAEAQSGYDGGTLVYVKVRAVIVDTLTADVIQRGPFSEQVAVLTMAGWPPAATDFTATAIDDFIRLTWVDHSPAEDPLNEAHWLIMRSTDGVNSNTSFLAPADATSFDDTTVVAGTTYHYRLEAINQYGAGYEIVQASATALPYTLPGPPPPILMEAHGTGPYTAMVRFINTYPGVNRHRLQYGPSITGPLSEEQIYHPEPLDSGEVVFLQTSNVFTPLSIVYLRAASQVVDPTTMEVIEEGPFSEFEVAVTDDRWPTMASNFQATFEDPFVQLTWVDDNGPNSYNETQWLLTRSEDSVNYTVLRYLPSNFTGFTDRDVAANKTYYYRLMALNSFGNGGEFVQSMVTIPALSTPTEWARNISFSNVTRTSMQLHFTPGNGNGRLIVIKAGSRPVFRPVNGTFYSGDVGNGEIAYENTSDTTVLLTGLTPDTDYFVYFFEFNRTETGINYLSEFPPLAVQRTAVSLYKFSLMNYKTGHIVRDFNDQVMIDVADPMLNDYSIRYNEVSTTPSVRFTINDRVINIDNYPPFLVHFWPIFKLTGGVHTLTAQAFSDYNAMGIPSTPSTASLLIINSAAITAFDIVDANGDSLKTLQPGDTINTADPAYEGFNIVARTNISTVSSVKVVLKKVNGIQVNRIDEDAPFTVGGINNGPDQPLSIAPGSYTLTVTPFMQDNAFGAAGFSAAVQFRVIHLPLSNARKSQGDKTESDNENTTRLALYPNPAKDKLHVQYQDNVEQPCELKVISVNGQALHTVSGTSSTFNDYLVDLDRLQLSSGVYVIQLYSTNGKMIVRRFMKD